MSFIVILFALLCCSISLTKANFLGKVSNIQESIIPLINKKTQAHPYRNANLLRPSHLWDYINVSHYKGNPSEYQVEKNIGEGTFAQVFEGIHLPTGDRVALKFCYTPRADQFFRREIQILQELEDAPNFLPIRDMYEVKGANGKDILVLVFDLFRVPLYRNVFKDFTKFQIKHFIYETLRTLDYAHSKGIIHRDLKPVNILMNPDTLETRVIDWGLADYYHPEKELGTLISTMPFKSPEILLDFGHYDYSVDIWSTGCILAEMIFKKIYFFGKDFSKESNDKVSPKYRDNVDKLNVIVKVLGTADLLEYVNKHKEFMNAELLKYVEMHEKVPLTDFINDKNRDLVDPLAIDLLEKMLVIDHTERITASDALQHPYFDDIRI